MGAECLIFERPQGDVTARFDDDGRLVALTLHQGRVRVEEAATRPSRGMTPLRRALERYFAGKPESFEAVELGALEGTAFQQSVWRALQEIPWGEATSYGALAAAIGRPRAARAVGQAVGANPLHIVIPCHRVLAGDGRLGGFSCGLDWKRALLALEGHSF